MHKLLTLLGFCLFITIYWLANAYINHVELEKRYELEQKRCLPSEPKPFNREGFKTFNFHGTWLQLNTEKFFLGPHKKTENGLCTEELVLGFYPNVLANQKHERTRGMRLILGKNVREGTGADHVKNQYLLSSQQSWENLGLTLYQSL